MMWDYAELPDGTAVAHSELLNDNTVEVAVERPIEGGFDEARCLLPSYTWSEVRGFTQEEMDYLDGFVRRNAPLIMRLAREAAKDYA